MPLAVEAVGIGKRYQLGTQARYRALRDVLSSPWSRRAKGRDFWALQDVSFSVDEGEVLGIVGRNGAGKSTLLKILSRITEPTTGRAVLYGRVGSLLEVGTGFHPELSGRENIYLNGAILGMRRAEIDRKFDDIVAFGEVEPFLDTPVKHYSSGMYVRLAFSVAAHLEPEILVVDEVLAVGDAQFQRKCMGKMEEVANRGRTVLFVSHNMPAVARLCTRGLLLEQGRVLMQGDVKDVVNAYLTGSSQGGARREWGSDGAPGSDAVRLRAVEAIGTNGGAASVTSVAEPIRIRVRYSVLQPGARFRCAVLLFTQGTCAFTAVEPSERTFARAGDHYSEVEIGQNLLAEGEYVVGVTIFSSRGGKDRHVQVRDALSFQTYDPMSGKSARGDYAQNLAGVVRPLLPWRQGEETPGDRR